MFADVSADMYDFSENFNYILLVFLFQNPGFDFSGAEISGNFTSGGPDFSSLQK